MRDIQLTRTRQPRHPQIHSPRPHRHQCKPEIATSHLLQGQEVHATRPSSETDTCHEETVIKGRGKSRVGEAEEEAEAFSGQELCGQGKQKRSWGQVNS